eukprot:COSAG02_NODE_3757_length_6277_cov_1.750405_5_plen_77_part_00
MTTEDEKVSLTQDRCSAAQPNECFDILHTPVFSVKMRDYSGYAINEVSLQSTSHSKFPTSALLSGCLRPFARLLAF